MMSDYLVTKLRKNLEHGVRVEETWSAIAVLACACDMEDWDEALALAIGMTRQQLADSQANSEARA